MFKCPECGNTDKFNLNVIAKVTYDQPSDFIEELNIEEWVEDGFCQCDQCDYKDNFVEFKTKGD